MKKIKLSKKQINIAKYLIVKIGENFRKKGFIVKDSNIYHFIAYTMNKKCNLGLTSGWFKHGPYILAIDDALIEMGMMETKQHQLYGDETISDVGVEKVK